MRGRGGSTAGAPRAATTSIGLDGRAVGTSTTVPMARLNGDLRMGGASFFPAGSLAFSVVASRALPVGEARAFFSAAGFAAASADSTEAFCSSASAMNGANFSGRLGGHAGARPTRLAAAGARRWAAQVCSSRSFQSFRWFSGSSPASSANRAAIAPACSSFAGSNSSWTRATPTADAPAYAERANAPAASVTWADSPPSWRAEGSPDSTSLRAICAEARVGDQIAGADEQVPDEGLRDAGLEQGTRGGETGTLGNAEVAGDLEQDRPAFAVRDELFLLVGRGRQGVRERSQGPGLAVAELAQVLVEVLPLAGSTLPERRQDRHLAALGIPAVAGRAGTPHRRERSPGERSEERRVGKECRSRWPP